MGNHSSLQEQPCPHCGQPHPPTARFCPVTGQSLPPLVPSCPRCGREVKAEWMRCPYCAAPLKSLPDRTPPIHPGWRSPGLLFIPLFVLGLGGVIWGVILISSNNSPPDQATTSQAGELFGRGSSDAAPQVTPPQSSATSPPPPPTYTRLPPRPSPTSPTPTLTRTVTVTHTPTPTWKPTITPTEGPWQACPGSYLSRLHVDDRAYVSFDPPLPNRVRSEPGKDSVIIGRIQTGEEVKIVGGPACEDGWVWWRVRSKETGLVGWTSEGDSEDYWLVPLP